MGLIRQLARPRLYSTLFTISGREKTTGEKKTKCTNRDMRIVKTTLPAFNLTQPKEAGELQTCINKLQCCMNVLITMTLITMPVLSSSKQPASFQRTTSERQAAVMQSIAGTQSAPLEMTYCMLTATFNSTLSVAVEAAERLENRQPIVRGVTTFVAFEQNIQKREKKDAT